MEPAFLTAIHIEKVRHLKDIDIPLSPSERKNLIFTGKNGSGKTSILDNLASYLQATVSGPKHETISEVVVGCRSFSQLRKRYNDGLLVLAYYRDNRSIETEFASGLERVSLKRIYNIWDAPVKDFVKYLVNLKAIQAFSLNEGSSNRAEEVREWFQSLETILRTIYEDDSLKLNFNTETFQFAITVNGREPFDFNTMSRGYAAVFDIIADLMMRMESQRRYDLDGIVLIDEIETHLHVELQKKIVPILTELFPNIQFIMTTHSPFVLNSAQNTVIYDLEKHMLVEEGLTNLPYEGIVEGYFGADRMSQELRGKFERYKALVGKAELTDEEFAETAELETYLDEVPDYLALEFSAEYSRLKLEFANRG